QPPSRCRESRYDLAVVVRAGWEAVNNQKGLIDRIFERPDLNGEYVEPGQPASPTDLLPRRDGFLRFHSRSFLRYRQPLQTTVREPTPREEKAPGGAPRTPEPRHANRRARRT